MLLINTTKFLVFAFSALGLYELVIYLYFKFTEGNDAKMSKTESRKRKEMLSVLPQKEVHPKRKNKGTSSPQTSNVADWASLIGYQEKRDENMMESCEIRMGSGVKVGEPQDNLYAQQQKETDRLLADLFSSKKREDVSEFSERLGEKTDEASDALTVNGQELMCVSTELPEQEIEQSPSKQEEDVKKYFADYDFSNMIGL